MVGAVGGIDETDKAEWIRRDREGRHFCAVRNFDRIHSSGWKRFDRFWSPIHDAPRCRLSKVSTQSLEAVVVDGGRTLCMPGELHNGVTDVEAPGDVGVDEFAEDAAVRELVLIDEGSGFFGMFDWAGGEINCFGEGIRHRFYVWAKAFVGTALTPTV